MIIQPDLSLPDVDLACTAGVTPLLLRATGAVVVGGETRRFNLTEEAATTQDVTSTFGAGRAERRRVGEWPDGISVDWELTHYPNQPWYTIAAKITNGGTQPARVDRIALLESKAQHLGFSARWQDWKVLLSAGGDAGLLGEKLQSPATLASSTVTGLVDPDSGYTLVLGFSATRAFGQIEFHHGPNGLSITAVSLEDGILLAPGESRWSERLHIGSLPLREAMERYAEATGREAGALVHAPSFAGWCSWYYYHPFADRDITEDLLIEFLQFAGEHRSDLPLKLFLLDDGYQTLPGDWTSFRPLFPHGMKWLVEQVNDAGLIPGLWISPFIAHRNSRLLADHPDWLLRSADGKPAEIMGNWGDETYAIDITRSDVLRWIAELFHIVRHDWGYRYVKIDFNTVPSGGVYDDSSVTRFQAARRVYQIIRDTMGRGAHIATCTGAPYPPSVGIAHACRTSGDVGPNWQTVKSISQTNLLRWAFHRRWWVGDPDCLVVRTLDSQLSESEIRVLATMLAMCGGLTYSSDPLATLPPDRLRLFQQIVPSYGEAARPLDLLDGPIPRLMHLDVQGTDSSWVVLAAFNWEDDQQDIAIDTTELGFAPGIRCHVFDLWSDRYHGLISGQYVLKSQLPHSCQLLAIRPEQPGQIELISSDLHYAQGAVEVIDISRQLTAPFSRDSCVAELMLTLRPPAVRGGKLVFAAGEKLVLAACQGARGILSRRDDGLWEAALSAMEDHVALLLRWRKSVPSRAVNNLSMRRQ